MCLKANSKIHLNIITVIPQIMIISKIKRYTREVEKDLPNEKAKMEVFYSPHFLIHSLNYFITNIRVYLVLRLCKILLYKRIMYFSTTFTQGDNRQNLVYFTV